MGINLYNDQQNDNPQFEIKNVMYYLTFWSLLVGFLVLVYSVFNKIPLPLFMAVYSGLLTVCLVGTFYLSIPKAIIENNYKIVLYDLVPHVLPIILLIIFLPFFSTRFIPNHKGIEYNFIYSTIIVIVFIFLYSIIDFSEKKYNSGILNTSFIKISMIALYISLFYVIFKRVN